MSFENERIELELQNTIVRLASENDAISWNNYLDSSKNRTFAHQWQWMKILEKSFGIKPYYFIAEKNNNIVGIMPTALIKSRIFGNFLISLPWLDYGGPVADDDSIARSLVDTAITTAVNAKCRFVEMRTVCHRLPDLVEKTEKYGFRLDLRDGVDAVWKAIDAKARNQVRKAEKSGLSVNFGRHDYLDEFYKVFSFNIRDLGTPVWPKSLFREILQHFPNQSEFAIVRLGNKTVAAGLIIHYGDYSGVPSASAYRRYLSLCPNNIMYWEVIKHCMERNSNIFDFGRSSLGANTYQFKKQWVKDPKEQVWQYKLISIGSLPELNPGNPKFRMAINLWRRLPLPVANFVGPKIVTKLP